MSSAKNRVSFVVRFDRAFRYRIARRGPRTDPWGQPAFVVSVGERASPNFTLCLLSVRYEVSHFRRLSVSPNSCLHLKRSPLCQILSK